MRELTEWTREDLLREADAHADNARELRRDLGRNHPVYRRAAKAAKRLQKLAKHAPSKR